MKGGFEKNEWNLQFKKKSILCVWGWVLGSNVIEWKIPLIFFQPPLSSKYSFVEDCKLKPTLICGIGLIIPVISEDDVVICRLSYKIIIISVVDGGG